MKNIPQIQRVNYLVSKGIKVGALSAFLSSFLYIILFIVFTSVVQLLPSTNPTVINRSAIQVFDGAIVVSGLMCMGGIIPATIIGIIGGSLIGLIFAFWKNRISSILASLIGLIVGIMLLLTISYFLWLDIYPLGNTSGPITFMEFFSLSRNPIYFIPTIIAIPISAYVGWKINKSKGSQIFEKQSDSK
jgi:hypothetical protein